MSSGKALVAALAALVVVGGAAIAVTRIIFGPSTDGAIALVPEDAQFYMNVFVRPSNGQKMAIEDLLGAGDITSEEAADRIAEIVDRALDDVGLTWEEDVDPALGDQVALFVADLETTFDPAAPEAPLESQSERVPSVAMLVGVRDEAQARELIAVGTRDTDSEVTAEKTYEGYDYTVYDDESAVGFVEDFAVAGTEDGFKAVVDTAAGGDSLQDSDRYRDLTSRLHGDNLALMYFDPSGLLDAARESDALALGEDAALRAVGDSLERPFGLALYVQPDGIVVESASPIPAEGPLAAMASLLERPAGIGSLPEDSWFAYGIPALGRFAEVFFELGVELEEAQGQLAEAEAQFEAFTGLDLREHVFDGIEGARLFVSGGIGPGTRGGVVVDTSDERVASDIVAAVRTLAQDRGVPLADLALEGYTDGFTFTDSNVPDSVHVVVDGTRIVAGFGTGATLAALEAEPSLSVTEKFRGATELLDGFEPFFFVDLDPPLAAFRNLVAPNIDGYPAATLDPLLDAASHLTAGTRRSGDYVLQRVVLGVESG